ncbi:MAG: ABC transporter permease [Silicimonas sp.]|nr:ABC transporter permease [Silicimonas sp.]
MQALAKFNRVIGALIIREMITRYGRSWGGYVWAILEPVGIILILALAFSQIVRSPAIGSSFVFFYATGYIPFHFFHETASSAGTSVSVNRPLLQLPMVTALDVVLARVLLSLITLIVVAIIIYSGLMILIDEAVRLSYGNLCSAFASGAILGLGVGMINAPLFEFLPAWRQVWGIISRPLFIISGVFFTFEELPEKVRELLWWNPLIHVVGEARRGFYPTYDGDYVTILYPTLLGAAMTVLGAAVLIRHRSRLTEVQ